MKRESTIGPRCAIIPLQLQLQAQLYIPLQVQGLDFNFNFGQFNLHFFPECINFDGYFGVVPRKGW